MLKLPPARAGFTLTLLVVVLHVGSPASADDAPRAVRLNDGRPIIAARHLVEAGLAKPTATPNINGPCLIRVPDWIVPERRAAPTANYYLYFADHDGRYIRLAWAENVAGPYTLYRMGADVADGQRGVLDLSDARRRIELGNGIEVHGHVASPDAHVNHDARRIELYFHGPARHNGRGLSQKTFVATSATGLDFTGEVQPVILGFAYFRVFEHRGQPYAIASRGSLYRARDRVAPWTASGDFDFARELWEPWGRNPSDNPWQHAITADPQGPIRARHFATYVDGDTLYAFHSRAGDAPERILLSIVNLADDWRAWRPSYPPIEILRPERDWEGMAHPVAPSREGATVRVRQLRDPAIFRDDDGQFYLLYTGAGEEAIGIAALENFPPKSR